MTAVTPLRRSPDNGEGPATGRRSESIRPLGRSLWRLVVPLVSTLACITVLAQQTTTTTYTFDPHFFNDSSYCVGGGCFGTSCPKPFTYDLGTFNDPLPPVSKLRSVAFTWRTGSDKTLSFQVVPNVTIFLDGTALGAQDITNVAVCSPGTALPYTWTSQDYTNGFPGYAYKTTTSNGPSVMSLSIADPSSGPMVGDQMSISLTYEVPPPVDFNVTDAAPESERRILLSNLHQGYLYPHFQSIGAKDAEVPMFVRARGQSGQYEANLTVYLRVTDPEDTAPYMNLATNKLAHKNDNVGPIPTIVGTGITSVANAAGVYQATSGANGEIDFTLKLGQGTAAGDNYQVEASFDQTFPTGASWKSGTLTAWKRIFVEKHKMLRNGLPITVVAGPGDSTIQVADNHYNGNQGHHRISRGDRIALIHGVALDRQDVNAGSYYEEHTVADVARGTGNDFVVTLGVKTGNKIAPETLSKPFGPDPTPSTGPSIADQITCLSFSSLSDADYFDASDDLVTGSKSPLRDAFAEYIVLPDGPSGFVPTPNINTTDEPILQEFANKWSYTGAGTSFAPGHQILMIADRDSSTSGVPLEGTGLTTSQVGGQRSSWVWKGWIDFEVSKQGLIPGGNADLWAAKTAVHELSHQFRPNTAFNRGDHCPTATTSYDDPSLYCMLATLDDANKVIAQRDNGIARFHLLKLPSGAWHSEYLEIRKYADPFVP